MKINKMSFEELNNVNLHDKIIQDFHFDRLTKRLVIPILPENEYDHNDEVHEMEFLNVLGLEITACDFCVRHRMSCRLVLFLKMRKI